MEHFSWELHQLLLARTWENQQILAARDWEISQILDSVKWENEQIGHKRSNIVHHDEQQVWENVPMPKKKNAAENEVAVEVETQSPESENVEVNPGLAKTRAVLIGDARKATRPQRVGRFSCCKQ